MLLMLGLGNTTTVFAANGAAEHRPTGVVEMFDFEGDFGTLTRAGSGVPRAKPNPVEEAVDRWRASAEPFTCGFAVSRGANGTESFRTRRVYEDQVGQAHVRLSQTIAGLPVVGSELIVHADVQTGRVLGVNGRFAIDRDLARSPRMNAREAIAAAMNEYGLTRAQVVGTPELTYIVDKHGEIRLAWTNLISYVSENGAELDRIYSDALTGAAIERHPQVRRAKYREMYDCLNQIQWSGCTFMFHEGELTIHPKARAAYDNGGLVWDYFFLKHNRDSVDGYGGFLRQAVNFGPDSSGTIGWEHTASPYHMIVYGDGFGKYSPEPVYSLDIVAHEFTHGVIYYEANLVYNGETASIDEGLADIFAVATSYDALAPDWWIGDDVSLLGPALRYLDDPAMKSDYADYYPTRERADPHQDAGISGLAFYLISEGGSHPRRSSVSVAAQGISKAEKIFYHALVAYMTSTTDFRSLESYTLKSASNLYGYQSAPYHAVADAWLAVGNHWETYGTNPPVGESRYTNAYTTVASGLHTGQLYGTDFDLYLERFNGSAWVTYTSSTGASPKRVIEAYPNPGTFRWRVHKARGTGSWTLFDLGWNHP